MGVRKLQSAPAVLACLTLLLFVLPARGQDRADDGWHFSLAPYVWLPTINGELHFQARSRPGLPGGGGPPVEGRLVTVSTELGPNDYLTHLEMALMLAGTARNGRWSLNGDLIYLNLASQKSRVGSVGGSSQRIPVGLEVNLGTETDLKTGVLTALAGYEVLNTKRASGAILFGARYVDVDADLHWDLQLDVTGTDFVLDRRGDVSRDEDRLDAVVGVKGRLWLDDAQRWYVPYYLDAGSGSSELTWQAMTGVAYAFQRSEFLFVYRHLEYSSDDAEDLVQDLTLSGPAIGWAFRF